MLHPQCLLATRDISILLLRIRSGITPPQGLTDSQMSHWSRKKGDYTHTQIFFDHAANWHYSVCTYTCTQKPSRTKSAFSHVCMCGYCFSLFSDAAEFFSKEGGRLGGRYWKARYVAYKDDTFTTKFEQHGSEHHLGFLGNFL